MSLPGTLYLLCLLVMFKGLSMEDSEIRINGDRRNRMTISHINTELSLIKKNMTQGNELASTRKLQGNTVNKIPDVRRVERGVDYDAQLVHNMSERALELCPYSDFCHLNGSELGANVWYGISCCKSCYCDIGCGDRMDCCFDFLDVVKVKEKNNLKCIKPLIEAKNKGKNMVFIFTQSYYMIDSCLSDSTYSCKNENSALWGSMYPVYSPSSKMIYVNHHCAECNGVRDANPWEVYINCNISDSISGTGLTNGIKYGRCSVQFRPANKGSVDRFACNGDVISSCNSTGRLDRTDQDLEEDQFLEDACALTRAEVITYAEGGIKVHANAFCKLCNGIKHYPHDVCIAPDDSIKMISNSLTTLIDWRVVSSFHHQKTLDQDQVDGPEECNTNEIKHPLKVIEKYKMITGRYVLTYFPQILL